MCNEYIYVCVIYIFYICFFYKLPAYFTFLNVLSLKAGGEQYVSIWINLSEILAPAVL